MSCQSNARTRCRRALTPASSSDVESAAGGGLSDAFGLAGFVNVDVVRNPELGSSPYLARAMIREIISLSAETTEAERGPLALATSLPMRRLELRAGKFGMADFFDLNQSGSDSHSQFMNWTVDNNGSGGGGALLEFHFSRDPPRRHGELPHRRQDKSVLAGT